MTRFNTIKVIIVDDHILFQEGLKAILEKESYFNFEVLACASSGKALLELLKTNQPDIIFLDLNMPDMDGIETLQIIKTQYPSIKVLVLTMYEDPKVVKKVLKAKVDGYILKKYGKAEILKAVSKTQENKLYLSKEIVYQSKEFTPPPKPTIFDDKYARTYRLTKRELQILRLISEANSNKEIAKELFISDQTVSVHRKNIMKKLNVSNTAGLIRAAFKHSLIE